MGLGPNSDSLIVLHQAVRAEGLSIHRHGVCDQGHGRSRIRVQVGTACGSRSPSPTPSWVWLGSGQVVGEEEEGAKTGKGVKAREELEAFLCLLPNPGSDVVDWLYHHVEGFPERA